MRASSVRSGRRSLSLLLLVVSAVGCRGGAPEGTGGPATSASVARNPPPRAANAAELALVAPVAPGTKLEGFDVVRVEGVSEGMLRVQCTRGNDAVRLDVVLASDGAPLPPATAGKYAVYYALRRGAPDDAERLAKALAAAIGKNTAVPTPEGLGPYAGKPRAKVL